MEFDILYGKGVSRPGEIIDMAADAGLVQKSGAWYSYGQDRIGQGRDNAIKYLEEHPDLMEKLATGVLRHNGIGVEGAVNGANHAAPQQQAGAPAAAAPAGAEDDKKGGQKGGARPRPN